MEKGQWKGKVKKIDQTRDVKDALDHLSTLVLSDQSLLLEAVVGLRETSCYWSEQRGGLYCLVYKRS